MSKYCCHSGCFIQASFGESSDVKPRFCKQHAPIGYVLVNSRKKSVLCKEPGCQHQRCFGARGGPVEYCRLHTKPGYIDQTSKKCQYPHCSQRRQNIMGSKFCDEHVTSPLPLTEELTELESPAVKRSVMVTDQPVEQAAQKRARVVEKLDSIKLKPTTSIYIDDSDQEREDQQLIDSICQRLNKDDGARILDKIVKQLKQ